MKRTPWFSADVWPVREGIYEWQCRIATNGRIRQATFDPSIQWDGTGKNTDFRPARNCVYCQWRGLTAPAKERK